MTEDTNPWGIYELPGHEAITDKITEAVETAKAQVTPGMDARSMYGLWNHHVSPVLEAIRGYGTTDGEPGNATFFELHHYWLSVKPPRK